ncbi:MAG: helix-turn-helix domain-containing protein [Geobacteraceae bacterium]
MTDTLDMFDSQEHILSAGQKLRETRIRRGISLDEVARVTRITKGYLRALEEDDHEKLPSEAYARGFFRIYATFLGLPPEEVLNFPTVIASKDLAEGATHAISKNAVSGLNRWGAKRWFWLIAALCLTAFLSGTYFFGDKDQSVATESASLPLVHPAEHSFTPPAPVPTGSEKVPGNPPAKLENEMEASSINPPITDQGIVLKMRALEDGYLDLTIDNQVTQHYDLKAGDLIAWKADKVFSLDMENAGGFEAELNGKLLKPFGEKGVPAHVILSAGYDGEKTNP